ncbi:PREDICTED: calsyntenin-1-like isoform X10 [Branchiostoma belcheri]|uniref:Calsyntenin-1-like isoform X10 n=1 Tax=Branchiostoma belcheri TaxID=7741 RepID=A0A6P4Z8D7_BRABE|nr:PREDICTED: calsyntenin-1-like isoform X9 [Branchiostoma belcheri]XP_019637681.1 PREDICTED: calsyntenin-1-like isoform X10 [Branchiostoma belcheri]
MIIRWSVLLLALLCGVLAEDVKSWEDDIEKVWTKGQDSSSEDDSDKYWRETKSSEEDDAEGNKHKPWLEIEDGQIFHGLINENDMSMVELHPKLKASDKDSGDAGKICQFRITQQDVPFDAYVLNPNTGEGYIRARKELNCEDKKEYTFTIQAYDCGIPEKGIQQKKSHKATVRIQVNDVNEHGPEFTASGYEATVMEGKKYENILKVEAEDRDCSPGFSQICSYEIVTPNVPFQISEDGIISNTEPLQYVDGHNYILTVTAYDCGQRRADLDVLVTITVKEQCHPGWKDFQKRIEYEPFSGTKALLPKVYLETCGEEVSDITTTFTLETSHIGKGCDRDTYSSSSLLKLCGASQGSIDLLPAPGLGSEWTQSLPTDEGHEGDQVFSFDGRQTGVQIPEGVVPKNLTNQFTIATWMKHRETFGGDKETILCKSDKKELNRHHYSLYVHNCKLMFLLRHDGGDLETFRPAEFHWKIPQVCDKQWHHYAITVDFPEVNLYVDGIPYSPFLVTDDWPLHPSKFDTRLTLGACWQGGDQEMSQFFRGELAGLLIHPGKTETRRVISCLHNCNESLEFHSFDETGPGSEVHFNPDQTQLFLRGEFTPKNPDNEAYTLDKYTKVLQKVAYQNGRQFPTPGMRALKIHTEVNCFDDETCIEVPDVDAYVMVLHPEEPTINLSGTDHLARRVTELDQGVTPFRDLRIVSTIVRDVEEEEEEELQEGGATEVTPISHNLDACQITVDPPLESGKEELTVPKEDLARLRLEKSAATNGLVIKGVDTIANYEDILRKVVYRNSKAGDYFDRVLKLKCSEMNGRYESNEYAVELKVLHTLNVANPESHVKVAAVAHNVPAQFVQSKSVVHEAAVPRQVPQVVASSQSANVVTSLVIVICVGFLIFMIVLGVYRIRAANRRNMDSEWDQAGEPRMEWDSSDLTITVNPMDVEYEGAESDSSDDDDDSAHDDSDSSDDDDEPPREVLGYEQELEWDSTAMVA